jgi:metallo-beta-lactamase class B
MRPLINGRTGFTGKLSGNYKIKKGGFEMRKLLLCKTLLASMALAALFGCGDGSSTTTQAGAISSTIVAKSADNVASVTIPAGTVLYSDIGKSLPATGTASAAVYNLKFISQGGTVTGSASAFKQNETINPLAVYGQLASDKSKAPDGSGVFFDIYLTAGTTPVKSISGTISANVKLPAGYAAAGSSVDYYSYGSGVIWTKEESATVKSDGSIDITTSNLSLAVTKFTDWVPPGNGLLPKGTYPVSGSPFGLFTFVIGASPTYTMTAKTALEVAIPLTSGSIALKAGSTTLYDFTATFTYNSNAYTFSGTLDKVSGKITGTYSGAASGNWTALSGFKGLIGDAQAIAGTDATLNQLLRIQTENSGGYNLPLAIADSTVVEPAKAFDNAYYLGYKGTGCWAITNTLGDIYLIDSLNTVADATNIIVPGLIKLGLNPAKIKGVLVTHGHGDHYGSSTYFASTYGAKIYMGAVDRDFMNDSAAAPQWGPKPTVTDVYTDGADLNLGGGLVVTTVLTPGHTPGGFSFIFPVYDNGVKHMAAVWGGSGIAVPDYPGDLSKIQPVSSTFTAQQRQAAIDLDVKYPTRTKMQYAQSLDYFSTFTRAAQVDVIIGVHGFMDNNVAKLEVLRNRKAGDANPFIIGYDIYSRYEQILKTTCLAYLAEVL